ncbi:glyoxalase-like protein [Anoxybacillus vitaminiphilus]|uniref:Glyoxalase-like protein n=1 Tax=Paranoxybacillus vitaminiphilus TaxID=581036 RepID=A0A327YF01_9BACL|nr:VOC family protein [Anoxybacillus vitaminiphilus]RAK19091.1 glyoxalase-like protein [Anoxybacillus vitaminiphilus]
MNITFDHLVHFTKSPEEAKTAFQLIGFHAIDGGKHPSWGTYNCLNYFTGLRYIEWIGFTDFDKAKTSDNVLIQQIVTDFHKEEGFSQLAFRTNDMDAVINHVQAKGRKPIGPFTGSRKREDGKVLSWSMLFIEEEQDDTCRYPFFIQWGEPEEARMKEMEPLMQHSIGSPSLSYIGMHVSDLDKSLQKYCHLFDMPRQSVTQNKDEFGPYSELFIGNISVRLYETAPIGHALINRPFLCGITKMPENKTIQVKNGIYQFTV